MKNIKIPPPQVRGVGGNITSIKIIPIILNSDDYYEKFNIDTKAYFVPGWRDYHYDPLGEHNTGLNTYTFGTNNIYGFMIAKNSNTLPFSTRYMVPCFLPVLEYT